LPIIFDGSLFAYYHQFYLADDIANLNLPTDYTNEALRARILMSEQGLVVFTVRNMDVRVRVELHGDEPRIEHEKADHVVMGSFRTSGRIVIAGLSDWVPTAARASVPPGTLRAMVISTGLDTLSEDGLDGNDYYVVHLWPDEGIGITVLRQWESD
jgi:hypothetical protein